MLNRCLFVLLLLSVAAGAGHALEPVALDDFVLYADSVIEIEKIADSTGKVGSDGQIEILKGRCGTLTGDLRAVDRIVNKGKILVAGNVLTAAGIDNFGTLTVNGLTDAAADIAPLVLPSLSFTIAGSDLEVPRGGWSQLAPGAYGRVEVNKDAVLELSSGVYDIIELDTEKHAVIKINAAAGAVTVNISGRLDIDQGVEIQIIEGSSRDVTFNFSGVKKVDVERKALFRGSLVAPYAKVEFGRRSRLEGMVIAGIIKLKKGSSFNPHENVSPSPSLVADAGEDRTVKVGDKVILDGSASYTTTENPLTFQWSWISHPAGSQASFSNAAASTPEWIPDLAGIYVAGLIVTDDTGSSASDHVTITVVPSQVDLDDFVLYADAEIRIDEIAGAIGYIGSNGKIEIVKGSAGAINGDLWALGSIRNHAEITIDGDVITNEQIHDKGHLTITGTIFENVNLPAVGLPEPAIGFDRDAPDHHAVMGSPINLTPGSYGRVRVDKGAVLRLAGGDYAIRELDVGDRALILIQGPVEIHLLKNLDVDDYVEWMITGSTPIRDVKIYLHGKKAEIDDHAVFRGTLIAPRAKVRLKKFSRLHGAVYARKIDLAEGVYVFHQDESLPHPSTYYRSIGTHSGELHSSGTATVAENSTRISFEAAGLPENIGKGDRITLIPNNGEPEVRYILKRDAGNQVTLQYPAGRNHTAVQYAIERAYNSIQSWEDDRQGDLVAENRYEVGICYNDGPLLGNGSGVLATIEGSNTDKERFMHLTVAETHRHFGTAGIGVILEGRGIDKFGLRVLDDYTRVGQLELKGFRSGTESAAVEVKDAKNVLLEQLLIHDFKSNYSSAAGIRGSGRSDFTARNCIIFNGDAAGIQTGGRGGTAVVQNCTIFGMEGRGVHEDKGTYLVQNTVAMANGLEDFKIERGRQSNNCSSDHTADGLGSMTYMLAANQFLSIDPEQPDLHLKDDADAYDKGFDLSMFYGIDVDGDQRPDGVAWDMGADEHMVSPVIEIHPVDLTVTEKKTATFSVTASGSRLQYQWQRKSGNELDFKDITGAVEAEYTIPVSTHLENDSQYRCIAYNRVNTAVSDAASLTVLLLPPVIITQPADPDATEYENATFSVAATGTLHEYQWQRRAVDAGEAGPFQNISGATKASYTIDSAQYVDSLFVYRCQVTNLGNDPVYSAAASLTVKLIPPDVKTHPTNVEITEYQSVSFSVAVVGTLLEYQWQRSSSETVSFVDIAGATQPTYTIDSAEYEDSQFVYRCKVSNLGNDPVYSDAARFKVNLLRPVINEHPTDVENIENQAASFTVKAEGTLLEYQWQKSENAEGPFVDIAGATESTYTIASAQYDDSLFVYRCKVSNLGNDPVYSDAANLKVDLLAPVINGNPTDVETTEYQPVSFFVAANGNLLEYQWQRSSSEGGPSADIDGATESMYTIESAQYDDSLFVYRCQVTNLGNDPVYSTAASLQVNLLAPVINEHPANAEVTEYQPVSFSVAVDGTLVEYQWQRSPSEGGPYIDIAGATEATYTIGSAQYDDSQFVYRCKVTNLGNDPVHSDAAGLKVNLLPPVINEHPTDAETAEYQPASFSVVAEGTLLEYQWQRSSSESGPFVDVSDAIEPIYTIGSANYDDSLYTYRCQVSNPGNGPLYSDPASLKVNLLAPVINEHPSDAEATEYQAASFTVIAEGTLLEYQWQKAVNEESAFVDIAGAIEPTYSIGSTQYDDSLFVYRCKVINLGNDPVYSDSASLKVTLLAPVINAHPTNAETTEYQPASFSVVAEGTLLEYQWQRSSSESGPFADVVGATESTYTIESAQYDDSLFVYRCQVTNFGNDPVYSGAARLKVNLLRPVINEHPTDEEAAEYQPVSFTVVADGTLLEYQWQRSSSENGPFDDIAGATESTYSIASAQYEDSQFVYRCKVTNLGNDPVYSDAASLTVNLLPPDVKTHPTDVEVTEYRSVSFSVAVDGTLLEYQWQRSQSETESFVDIAGATQPTHTIDSAEYEDSQFVYRCKVTNLGNDPVYSDAAGLKVNLLAPVINEHPTDAEAIEYQPASFTVQAEGTLLQYQWQRASSESGPFADIVGATESTYTIESAQYEDSQLVYRCSISNPGNDPVESNPVGLTVQLLPPTITKQPVDSDVTEYESATFSVKATGTLREYQWQKRTVGSDEADPFQNITGATESNYTIDSAQYVDSLFVYRCKVTNLGNVPVYSDPASLKVNLLLPVINEHPTNAEAAEYQSASFSVAAEGTLLEYQWQRSPKVEESFEDIAGATKATYTIDSAQYDDSQFFYRCQVTNLGNDPVYSAAASLTVNLLPPDVKTHPTDVEVTEYRSVSFSVAVAGTLLEYQWQRSSSGTESFVDIAGATQPTYSIDSAEYKDSQFVYRCQVTNLGNDPIYSTAASLQVNLLAPVINEHPANAEVTEYQPASFLVVAEGSLLEYQWQQASSEVGLFVDIAGATESTYTIDSAQYDDSLVVYRCQVSNIGNDPVYSDSARLKVNLLPPLINGPPTDSEVTEYQSASFSMIAEGTLLKYQWQRASNEAGAFADIAGATESTYTIASAQYDDSQFVYRCRVSNLGNDPLYSTAANLKVNLLPPVIKTHPTDAEATEYQVATLLVVAEGTLLEYQWQRSPNVNDPFVDITGATESTYTIESAQYSDSLYIYRCQVSNLGNNHLHSDAAGLKVNLLAPVINDHPTDTETTEYQSASFMVVAEGTLLEYQWQKSANAEGPFEDIAGAIEPTYTIGSAQYDDSPFVYRCKVINLGNDPLYTNSAELIVNLLPPDVKTHPTDAEITEYQSVSFSVAVDGTLLEYQWQRSSSESGPFVDVTGAIDPTYTIGSANYDDSRYVYRCQVTNLGNDPVYSAAARLKVNLLRPVINEHPTDEEAAEYQPVSFTVVADGTLLEYQWQRASNEGGPFEDIAGATESIYTIDSAQYDDSQFVYRCQVTNLGNDPVYSAAASFTVNLLPPDVKAHPTNAEITEYQSVSFSVAVDGTLLEYQWQRSSSETESFVDIADATQLTYTIDSAEYEDSQFVYRCKVTNLGNEPVHSDAAGLKVNLLAPVINEHPANAVVTEYQPASFLVVAEGSLLEYQWQRASSEVGPFVDIAGATESTYTIDSAQYDDSQFVYRCQVTNLGNDPVYSAAANLTVNLLPPDIKTHPAIAEITEYQSVSFSVAVDGTLVDYQWQRSPSEGGPYVDIAGATEATYTIDSAQYDDSQFVYRCKVSNLGNEPVYSDSASMKVNLLAPVINAHPTNAETTEYQPAYFSVVAEGTLLEYQWQQSPIVEESFEDIAGATEATYTIDSAEYDDSLVVYRCRVSNVGNSPVYSDSASLNVNLLPPAINEQPTDAETTEYQAATFTVVAEGTLLEYQWQKSENAESSFVDIAGATESTYTIASAQYDDSLFVYRCKVYNLGKDPVYSMAASLKVNLLPPTITNNPVDPAATEYENATFKIEATGTLREYQWQRRAVGADKTDPFSDISGATGSSYTIDSVEYEDSLYVYRCEVSNPGNDPVFSDAAPLTVHLLPPTITKHPVDLTVTEGESTTLAIQATGTLLTYQWQKKSTGEDLFVDIADATAAVYSISATNLSDHATYRCAISNNDWPDILSNQAFVFVDMKIPAETSTTSISSATWENGHVKLAWGPVEDVTFRIFRGTNSENLVFLANSTESQFLDESSIYYRTYYYRVATVRHYQHPYAAKTYEAVGPPSEIATLKGLPLPKVAISDSTLTPDGDFRIIVGKSGPYAVSGTYTEMSGEIEVLGTSSGVTGSGGGANGIFSISLSKSGTWQIVVSEKAGWKTVPLTLILAVDDKAPDLIVNAPAEVTTTDDFITINGVATDAGIGLGSVVISSDRYAGNPFGAIVDSVGKFSAEIPLKVGENQLGVTAGDKVGNQYRQDVKVTVQPTALPLILISEPANGSKVSEQVISVTGVIRSSLPPEQIRLELAGQIVFPTGANSEYNFNFNNIRLAEGSNSLIIRAVTPYDSVHAQTTVSLQAEAQIAQQAPPVLEIDAHGPEIYVSDDHVVVQGTAGSEAGIKSITINGEVVELTGSFDFGSFETQLYFSDQNQDSITVTVEVTDENDQTSTVTYIVRRDAGKPVIDLTDADLNLTPAVNDVKETPYILSGTVTDSNLAGFTINAQNVGLLPAPASENAYAFEAGVSLTRGNQMPVVLNAWDRAGNQISKELILRLDSHLEIDIISPQEDSELVANEATVDLNVVVRVPGLADGDRVVVKIDGANPIELDLSGETATGVMNLDYSAGRHDLKVEVLNAADDLLASRTTRFSMVDASDIQLALQRQEPVNGAVDIEPNAFIAFYFTKSIDPAKLQFDVKETVHGKVYRQPAKGADVTQQSAIELVGVDWDQEPIAGGIAWFPGNAMAAYYPNRDFTYGATVYVAVNYKGAELSRSIFHIRPLPTLIQGFVAGQDMQPVEDIEIVLTDFGLSTETDKNGKYGFGFGEPAQNAIPAGRYQAVVNPDLKNPAYGTVSIWVNVQAERLNSIGITPVPKLDPEQPFRPIISGENAVAFADGELTLNPSDATLVFPDGQSQGVIHVQPMELGQLAYPALPSALPHAAFAVHPAGVEMSGNLKVTFELAEIGGSLDYIDSVGERVVLVGLDPASLQLVPVGVGRIDRQKVQITSEGHTALKRLDYLGYAFVEGDAQSILQRYAEYEIGLLEMIGELQSRF